MQITQEQYDNMLIEILKEDGANIIRIPGIYEILAEEYNNEILKRLGQ